MNRFDQLAELQALDMRRDENLRVRREAEARLADRTTLIASHNALDEAEASTREIRIRLRSLELEANGLGEKVNAVETRLYDGRTSNPKELSGLEQDAEMLKRRKSQLEDEILEEMAQLETAEAALATVRGLFDKVSAETSAAAGRARLDMDELLAAEAKLRAVREKLCGQISPPDVALYESLRREKKGRALARLKGSACEACGFSVPSGLASRVRVGQELELCSNCGRILIS